jgi:hypothetical protein
LKETHRRIIIPVTRSSKGSSVIDLLSPSKKKRAIEKKRIGEAKIV